MLLLILQVLQQSKSGFKKTINWNKYQSIVKTFAQNRYFQGLTDSSFQGVNRLFVLSFEDKDDRTSHSNYYLPKVELNNTNKTYENIRKITTGKGDDYTTGCLSDYSYLKSNYKMIAIDLSKQKALDADPTAIKQINFTASLDRDDEATLFFIIEVAKETVLDFLQGTVNAL